MRSMSLLVVGSFSAEVKFEDQNVKIDKGGGGT
jgi:hypothetical protein